MHKTVDETLGTYQNPPRTVGPSPTSPNIDESLSIELRSRLEEAVKCYEYNQEQHQQHYQVTQQAKLVIEACRAAIDKLEGADKVDTQQPMGY